MPRAALPSPALQVDLSKARSAADAERAAREDAAAAVVKLQGAVASVRQEMIQAQKASNQVRAVGASCGRLQGCRRLPGR